MGVHGCRLYYNVRHPVARTEANQLRVKTTATQARPDWIATGCKHANPQMFKEGMPEIQPIPDDEDSALRAGRDRMCYPISARDDRCIVLESKRRQARCTLSLMNRHEFKVAYPSSSPQLPVTLHEQFVKDIKTKPDPEAYFVLSSTKPTLTAYWSNSSPTYKRALRRCLHVTPSKILR